MGLASFTLTTQHGVLPLSTDSMVELEENRSYCVSSSFSASMEPVVYWGERQLKALGGVWSFSVGHWVGDSQITIEIEGVAYCIPTRVKPREEKLSDDLWIALLQDIEGWLPGISVGVEGGRHGGVGVCGVTAPFIAEALLPLIPALCGAFQALVRNLRETEILKWEDVPLHMMRRVDRETLSWVSRHPEAAVALDPWKSLETAPPVLPRLMAHDSIDHPANRYMAWLIKQVGRRLSDTASALEAASEKNTANDDTKEWCSARAAKLRSDIARLHNILTVSPLARLKKEPASEAAFQVVIDDPTYSRVQKLARLFLNPLFAPDSDQDTFKAAVRPSYSIYEIWCFLSVVAQMNELLSGWSWQHHKIDSLLKLDGSGEGARACASSDAGELEILFNPTFSGYFNRSGKKRWSLSKERRPDIVITYKPADAASEDGRWLCLDAKYRVGRDNLGDAFESVHIYKDALRYEGFDGACCSCLLLSPSETTDAAEWYQESFMQQFGAGVWKLRPGHDNRRLAKRICTTLRIKDPVAAVTNQVQAYEQMTNEQPYIREDGGCLIRVLEALDGYMSKFGTWPTGLSLGKEVIAPLKENKLTESGYTRLNEMFPITLNQAGDLHIVATGDCG